MNFRDYSNLDGKHAVFTASQPYWLNDTDEGIIKRFRGQYTAQIGTIIHDFARKYIKHGLRLSKSDRKSIIIDLLDSGIPGSIIDSLDIDFIFENVQEYVNDAVSFRMSPEVHLYYSDNFFGTTDAIAFDERRKKLKIFDLKTGSTPPHMEQLIIYAALFCLDYKQDPYSFDTELKIYRNCEMQTAEPEADVIKDTMERIKHFDSIITKERNY